MTLLHHNDIYVGTYDAQPSEVPYIMTGDWKKCASECLLTSLEVQYGGSWYVPQKNKSTLICMILEKIKALTSLEGLRTYFVFA
jgi:hypothetical protein